MLEINNYKVFETIPSLIIKRETLINIEPKIDDSVQRRSYIWCRLFRII